MPERVQMMVATAGAEELHVGAAGEDLRTTVEEHLLDFDDASLEVEPAADEFDLAEDWTFEMLILRTVAVVAAAAPAVDVGAVASAFVTG